ncbi:hypothetical protein SUVC_06G0880 [Saccharomyces uvarum]|uniref:Uncharacterized protein n=1 Tax=Saccharomyces uvarum TaxID=230603 RepID=A0AA35JHW1_SACUV|nr:hypothetical protein SUVC_06G0880 [Saccharomyces uvarum]
MRPFSRGSSSFYFVNDDNLRCIVQLIEHTIEMKIKISIEISLSLLSEHYKRNETCISNMLIIGDGAERRSHCRGILYLLKYGLGHIAEAARALFTCLRSWSSCSNQSGPICLLASVLDRPVRV